ncbi:MAG: tRNA ((7)-)-methyltransferase [Chthoniobacteraceae bacterium]|nr:tRNA ((7)-)-methyltransferase [Chthoniobacteraceae bacterium]
MSEKDHTPGDPLSEAAKLIEFVPENFFKRVPMEELFPRTAPLEVDIGCGEGAFIAAMAERHSERNFLGIERLLGRVNTVSRIAAHRRLTNVRVMRVESAYVVEHLLPPGSVSVAHVLFPDPWPKRYHHPRRLVQDAFMVALHGLLGPGGELRAKTDDLPYFQWMEKVFAKAAGFERVEWPEEADAPVTNFERRFLNKGLPIYRARLRKI